MMAQNIEIVSGSNSKLKPYPKDKPSAFIHPKTDTALLQFVATYKGTVTDNMIGAADLFSIIKKEARKNGANCFKLNSLVYDSSHKPVLLIDAYYASQETLAANASYYEPNTIYIFSSGRTGSDSFSLKINDRVTTFNNEQYLKFTLTEGEDLKLSKGGFTGAKARLKYEKGKRPLFLMVFGTNNMGGAPLPPAGTMGITFTTGQIKEMTDDYGQFHVLTLKQAN